MSRREAMSSIDTAWLRMDRSTNHMMIVAVLTCEPRLSYDRLQRVIASRFLSHDRFRDRVVVQGDTAYWEADPYFDLAYHVRRTALPGAHGKQELQDLVGELLSTPFDPERPLWQFHLVERYGKGSAVILCMHHCYADGIALVQVLLSMTDDSSAAPEGAETAQTGAEAPALLDWLAPVTRAMETAVKTGSGMVAAYVDLLFHPSHAVDYARQGADLAVEAARLALMPTDSPTRFKGKPGGMKRAAWTDRLPLAEIKALGHRTGCSVNDVMLSCVAGALRAYLAAQGDTVDDVELRALVPVNLRPPVDDAEALGNRFGLVAVLLPVGYANPLERLYQVRSRMQALKASSQAFVTLSLLAALGMGPKPLQRQVLDLLASRATAVMTNVPGPRGPRYLGGCRMRELVCWVPQSADIGMGLSVISYDGALQFGVVTDKNMASDPENIVSRFPEQLDQLRLAVAADGAAAEQSGTPRTKREVKQRELKRARPVRP